MPAHQEGGLHGLDQPGGQPRQGGGVGEVLDQDGELVAAQAGHRIGRLRESGQAVGDREAASSTVGDRGSR